MCMTIEIKQRNGQLNQVILDDGDYAVLSKCQWHRTAETCHNGPTYARRTIPGTLGTHGVMMHHEVLRLAGITIPEGMEVDHVNGNGLDNRRENLRVVTHAENMRNRHQRMVLESGIPGVYPMRRPGWDRPTSRPNKLPGMLWNIKPLINGVRWQLGYTRDLSYAKWAVQNPEKAKAELEQRKADKLARRLAV